MGSTVDAQAPLTSSPDVGIGEAARMVGIAPSAIRYYEEQGLLDAPQRRDGRRRYGRAELRTLTFVTVARELGFPVAAIHGAVHPGPGGWARTVDAQVAALDATIKRATEARDILLAARDCPAEQPVRECPHLHRSLDELLA